MDANVQELLQQVRARLEAVYGTRLDRVVLYGSFARGTVTRDSDIDLLVILRDRVISGEDRRAAIHALYPLTLAYGHPCSPTVVDAATYAAAEYPLYATVRAYGMEL